MVRDCHIDWLVRFDKLSDLSNHSDREETRTQVFALFPVLVSLRLPQGATVYRSLNDCILRRDGDAGGQDSKESIATAIIKVIIK